MTKVDDRGINMKERSAWREAERKGYDPIQLKHLRKRDRETEPDTESEVCAMISE